MKKATLAQRDKLWEIVKQDGTPRDQMQRLIASGLWSDLLHANFWSRIDRDEVRHALGLKPVTYPITVDYDLPFDEAFQSHPLKWWSPDFTDENFPAKRTGIASLEIRLIRYDSDMTTEGICVDFVNRKLRPADLRELLAFGKRYPKVHVDGEFSVVALGSSATLFDHIRGGQGLFRESPCLTLNEDGTGMELTDTNTIWRADRDYRFAAVVP